MRNKLIVQNRSKTLLRKCLIEKTFAFIPLNRQSYRIVHKHITSLILYLRQRIIRYSIYNNVTIFSIPHHILLYP